MKKCANTTSYLQPTGDRETALTKARLQKYKPVLKWRPSKHAKGRKQAVQSDFDNPNLNQFKGDKRQP